MAKVFPHDSGYMQTVNGRRERLRAALETLVAENGWRRSGETFIPKRVLVSRRDRRERKRR